MLDRKTGKGRKGLTFIKKLIEDSKSENFSELVKKAEKIEMAFRAS